LHPGSSPEIIRRGRLSCDKYFWFVVYPPGLVPRDGGSVGPVMPTWTGPGWLRLGTNQVNAPVKGGGGTDR
jgi:hypothetical protein